MGTTFGSDGTGRGVKSAVSPLAELTGGGRAVEATVSGVATLKGEWLDPALASTVMKYF